ncbi:Autonomous glycyl radical cofactor [bioreactor metagenome]|uniref:Autonomous glycyl radical cofactor n=1 Tax=bioreactor metagenome TaxID=1076179 RepID=A0A645I6S7_9ZZZZ
MLTVSLTRNGLDRDILAALEQAFLETGVEMLQLNCVNPDELRDAVEHPEAHPDLVVRLYGYSARFAKLAPEQQQEFISRQLY